jgi:hypothetical protein
VSDDPLNDAVILLDGAIEHANRWPHGVAEEWDVDRFQQAGASMEEAIALMQQAVEDVISTDPGGAWGTFGGPPSRPHLSRALAFALRARQLIGRVLEGGDGDREALRRAEKAIDRAWDKMAGVAAS